MLNNNELQRTNLYEQIAKKIEEDIILNPDMIGEKLPSEQMMADNFNVSRNVVREAFKVLKERGFIEVKNGDGAYASRPRPEMLIDLVERMIRTDCTEIKEIFEIRSALEVAAVRLAALRADSKNISLMKNYLNNMENNKSDKIKWAENDLFFHLEIVKAANNRFFYTLYKSITLPIKLLFEKAWGNNNAMNDGIEYHKAIINAIENRDEQQAAIIMGKHLFMSINDLQNYIINNNKEGND